MRDLTQGSIPGHIVAMAIPMAVGMLVQTLYFLVDLYFVSRLGEVALAGVSSAGNIMFLVMGFTQILNVGTVAVIAHAVGRKDQEDANRVFNQSMVLAAAGTLLTLICGYWLGPWYMQHIGADAATTEAGTSYLNWFIPSLALQFVLASMGAALRGTGIVKPTMIVQMLTVVLNIILAPILIAGWVTGHPMGVAGAGLASSLSVIVGVVLLGLYFIRLEKYVRFKPTFWRPDIAIWRRITAIGLPAGGEFALMFLYMAVIYWVIKDFGSSAQAAFGLGSRIMQAVFLPAMAVAFSAPAVAGQNFGAGNAARVRETFKSAVIMSTVLMVLITVLCQLQPEWLLGAFASDAEVLAVSATFLQLISWNFIFSGFIFTCSGMFQAMGNTWPALFSTASRLITFVIPAVWLTTVSGFRIEHVWYLSVATVVLQALISGWLIRRELHLRLRQFDNPATGKMVA